MQTRMLFVAGVILFLVSSCTQDIRKMEITEENKDSFQEQVRSSTGLSGEEHELLAGYLARRGLSSVFGGTPLPLVGKRVGELIDDQREWLKNVEAQAAEEKKLAEEAKKKEDAIAAQLREAIALSVYDKDFLESNYRLNRYTDYITIKVSYENKSAKDIRAFQGVVVFRDLFGDLVYQSSLKISDPIRSGAKGKWNGSIDYNQFDDQLTRFRGMKLEDLKVEWRPTTVILSDGTTLGMGAPNDG